MDINATQKSSQSLRYTPDTFDDLLAKLREIGAAQAHQLGLFIGQEEEQKEKALKKVADQMELEIREVDLSEVITNSEPESYKNIDRLWAKEASIDAILYFKNSLSLNGVYTGNTQSKVKYATPQERYFLKKMQQSGCFSIIDVENASDASVTLHRAASWSVHFDTERSFFQNLIAGFKDIHTQGNEFRSKRPLRYRKTAGNF